MRLRSISHTIRPAPATASSSPPACALCEDAATALAAELADRVPIWVRRVAASSVEGRELIAAHRAAMLPVVLVGDQLVSCGRLSRGRLRRLLIESCGQMSRG